MAVVRNYRGLLSLCATATFGVSLLIAPVATRAQEATPGATTLPANCTVVATGLMNPRGVDIASDGTLYIAEAGNAGDEQIFMPAGEGTPAATEVLTTVGDSGQITRIAPDGTQSVVATGLPSYTFGTEIIGPSGVAVAGDTVYVSVGGPGPAVSLVPDRPNVNSVVSIDTATGAVTTLANIGAYEKSTNPDPNAVDSNLGGLTVGGDGMLYVADAGGNTVYKVDPATGELSVFAVIPGLPAPGVQNPERGGLEEVDPVPTDVAPAPDGGLYVSLLTGAIAWGTPGSAKVLHIAPDGTITDALTGLNLAVSVAVAADGSLVAGQISENFFAQPPAAGVVSEGTVGGAPTAIIPGLPLPYGVAVGTDGSIYVVINSTAPAGAPPAGQVLHCTRDGGSTATAPSFTIEAIDISFKQKAVTIPANTEVTIVVENKGVAPHQFSIDELNIHTPVINAGESTTVTINAAPGSYTFYCAIPGHRQAGMAGKLTVQ